MSVLRQLLQLFVAGALFVGCGAGLASGVYRLDINHLEAQMKARVGAMPARVRAKMQAADLRLSVDGDTAKLLSNAAAKGEPPRNPDRMVKVSVLADQPG